MIPTFFFVYHILWSIPEHLNLPPTFSDVLHVINSVIWGLGQFSLKNDVRLNPIKSHISLIRLWFTCPSVRVPISCNTGKENNLDLIQIWFVYTLICFIVVACFVYIYLYCYLSVVDSELSNLPEQMIHPLPFCDYMLVNLKFSLECCVDRFLSLFILANISYTLLQKLRHMIAPLVSSDFSQNMFVSIF